MSQEQCSTLVLVSVYVTVLIQTCFNLCIWDYPINTCDDNRGDWVQTQPTCPGTYYMIKLGNGFIMVFLFTQTFVDRS